ncbi:M20/M25/M40 family metallo-hydrolase [Amycolatopsis alba]|uniref:Acetyl-lysine deacetylase n=1 Tax=Amycolatopsis alba DSM 44262 TaxID=1125972 RepID=A0A229S1U8_AMYAL|nr:M20/M25/M40 family metallo-hydrolase [Amycolatopsis alba]OXM52846.1 acetyl-lysine deacetylase [Amycolatopsis alba DSM 44262]
MTTFSETAAIELLQGMVKIPSPSFSESELAGHTVDAMRAAGFTARVDEAGNAVGEIDRGPGPTVMLLGHMDTVPGEIPVRVEGDLLYGRGAVDAKGPLATMICAAVGSTGFRGRIVVVGAVEEETTMSRGAVWIRRTHAPPDALVIGEPSGCDAVVLGYKGKIDLRYEVRCEATHPSNVTPKASELAARAWADLLDLLGPEAGHARFDQPGPTLVSIEGGLTSATAEFSIRIPPGFDRDSLVAALSGRQDPGTLRVLNSVRACRVGRTDPVASALSIAIRAEGARPRAKVKTGTSDMNTLAEEWSMPMATYGPGDSSLDHSGREHIKLSEYLFGVRVLTRALTELGERLTGEGR